MITPTTVIFGAGAQEVEAYALDNARHVVAPDTATATIVDLSRLEDDTNRIVLATGPATIDPATATTTASAGLRARDQRQLQLDALPAGLVVGRRYRVSDGAGADVFTLDRIDAAGLAVYARDPFRFDYDAGAALTGLRVSVEFPAEVADDEDQLHWRRPFGVDWTFDGVDGPPRARTVVTIERIARSGYASVGDITRIDSQLAAIHGDRVKPESAIEQGELEMVLRMQARGYAPEQLLNNPYMTQAVAWRAVELIYRLLGPKHEERARWANAEYEKHADSVILGIPPIDTRQMSRRSDRHVEPQRKSPFRAA